MKDQDNKNISKKSSASIGAIVLKAILVLIFAGFILLWVGACVGNFLDVDESPFPSLHWKAN